jgi:phosphotransferase family enzyme
LLCALAAGSDEGELAEAVAYRQSLIHGDLHLGNIMLGPKSVLIDFARSDVGPIAVDAAKLTADLMVSSDELRGASLPAWSSEEAWLSRALAPVKAIAGSQEGNSKIFDLMLRVFLGLYMNYDGVPDATRSWVRSVLA